MLGRVLEIRPRVDTERFAAQLNETYRLRSRIFNQCLRWDTRSSGGLEKDPYDECFPHYLISIDEYDRINGCLRMMPTTGRCMMKEQLLELFGEFSPPASGSEWELSRFIAHDDCGADAGQASIGHCSHDLITAAIHFAMKHGISRYIAAVTPELFGNLNRMGLKMQPYTDEYVCLPGGVAARGIYVDVDAQDLFFSKRCVRHL